MSHSVGYIYVLEQNRAGSKRAQLNRYKLEEYRRVKVWMVFLPEANARGVPLLLLAIVLCYP